MKVNVTKIFNVQIQEIIPLKSGKKTYAFHTLFDFITNYKEFFLFRGMLMKKMFRFMVNI